MTWVAEAVQVGGVVEHIDVAPGVGLPFDEGHQRAAVLAQGVAVVVEEKPGGWHGSRKTNVLVENLSINRVWSIL